MISGHIITHFAMFIIARRINVENYANLDTRDSDYEIRVEEYQTFTFIKLLIKELLCQDGEW